MVVNFLFGSILLTGLRPAKASLASLYNPALSPRRALCPIPLPSVSPLSTSCLCHIPVIMPLTHSFTNMVILQTPRRPHGPGQHFIRLGVIYKVFFCRAPFQLPARTHGIIPGLYRQCKPLCLIFCVSNRLLLAFYAPCKIGIVGSFVCSRLMQKGLAGIRPEHSNDGKTPDFACY
jgi:hypothetical protein